MRPDLYQSIVEFGNDGILVCDERLRITYANRMASEITGYSNTDLLGMKITSLFSRGDLPLFNDLLSQSRGDERKVRVESQLLTSSREVKEVEVCLVLSQSGEGEAQTYAYLCDITARKRIENELRDANEFFKNLIESSVDGIIAADMKGNIFIFNKGAEALTGHKAEEVVRKIHITKIYPAGIAKDVMEKLRSPDYGGVGKLAPFQLTVLDKSGKEIPIQISAALIYDGTGKEVASVGIFTDLRPRITIEKRLEETHLQLVSSEKMASLGKLAAGIAHEINNPLGGILIYASLMMEDLPEGDPKRQDLARIVQETSRCKDIVKSLLEFARQTEPKMEPTDINRAITDGLFFLENQALFHNIRIVKRLDPDLPSPPGNAGQLKQVFMNIIVNAAEAIHGSGTLTITTSVKPDHRSILVEFTDTGEGIPEENLTRIFDPFFTTKDVGKGTGLGLATSYGIIEGHGGRIGVKSKVGEGTTFTIELPIHSGKQPSLEKQPIQDQGVNHEFDHADSSEGEPLSL